MRYRHDAKAPEGTRIYAIGDLHGGSIFCRSWKR